MQRYIRNLAERREWVSVSRRVRADLSIGTLEFSLFKQGEAMSSYQSRGTLVRASLSNGEDWCCNCHVREHPCRRWWMSLVESLEHEKSDHV